MNVWNNICGRLRVGHLILAAALGLTVWAAAPAPAEARVFVGIGVPFPGLYPYPYYPYPPPYYYPPPPPMAYYPPPPGPGPAPAAAPASAGAAASITYTERPAFKNASGQACREVRYANGGTGTAVPRIRTFQGTRKGRSSPGSVKRRRTTASWAAVNAIKTPKLYRLARNRTGPPATLAINSRRQEMAAALTIEAGEISVRRFSRPNALGSIS